MPAEGNDHRSAKRKALDEHIAAEPQLAPSDLPGEATAMEEAQRLLESMNLARMAKENPPPQAWFDGDEPKPF